MTQECLCPTTSSETYTPASLERRSLLVGIGAAAGAAMFAGGASAQSTPQNAISPDAALKRIMDGNARYVSNTARNRDYSVGRAARAESQHPVAAILSCADSRQSPEIVFDEGPGDLFVVRVAGNFVTTEGLASLEYAVEVLKTPLIVVLGHSRCGAVDAAVAHVATGYRYPGHLHSLIQPIVPAVRAAAAQRPGEVLGVAIKENVRINVARLLKAGPLIAPKVTSGKVRVVGAEYELKTGKVALI